MGEFESGRVWTWASLNVGEFESGRVWTWASFGRGRVWTWARVFERGKDCRWASLKSLDVGEF